MEKYWTRYGLEFNPFIKNSKNLFIETSEYQELKVRLNSLFEIKGFGLIVGEPGHGKTTMIRNYIKTLPKSAYKIIYLSMSTLTVKEFYMQLAESLDLTPRYRKNDLFREIQSAINQLIYEKRITPVFIFDECNYMNNAILNDLKMIFNFDMDSKDHAVVLMVGLPTITRNLKLTAHEPLRQRMIINYKLEPLNKTESLAYIKDKLQGGKTIQEVFNENAIEAIINASNGTCRVIDRICDRAMFIGAIRKTEVIDSDLILETIEEVVI